MTFNSAFAIFTETCSKFLNGTNMNSFRSFVLTLLFSAVITGFSTVACVMVLDESSANAVLSKDPAISAAARTTETSHHNTGKVIIDGVLQVFLLALGIGAASIYGDRTTSREHFEGKAKLEEAKVKGQISGTAAAAAAAQVVSDAKTAMITKEHQALNGGGTD